MNNGKQLHILELYPKDMNIYGDTGNTLTLVKRAEWYGYKPVVTSYNQGDNFPNDIDIIIGGGGQDSGQTKIQDDLLAIGDTLKKLANEDTPMLVICGLYQLFGHFFETVNGTTIKGVGLLDVKTYGKAKRLIGNTISHSDDFGDIIGYENHSGQTYLSNDTAPLGNIKKGIGNNEEERTEGARYRNVIGSYLHGSLLPKNPAIADFLLRQAALKRYGKFSEIVIDDSLTDLARQHAARRPR